MPRHAYQISISARRQHEQWVQELTAIPTVAGREGRVIAWVSRWVARRPGLALAADRAGNLLISRASRDSRRSRSKPIVVTAHLDHPGFVVLGVTSPGVVELEFRGGVADAYFQNASIELIDRRDRTHVAKILTYDGTAKPFARVTARLELPMASIVPGDIGRWAFDGSVSLPRIIDGRLHTHACDDLAALSAALSAFDVLHRRADCHHVSVLLTRAEEVGFVGAIACCKSRTVPKNARLICLENSRSFADSPIGAGPIVRVGDKTSVFGPSLTNRISAVAQAHQQRQPKFTWQRKLMAGGTCEATTFSAYGYESACLCLPLGNYHNMVDIDGVQRGERPAHVGPEVIAIDDYHGLVELLIACATTLDSDTGPSLRQRMETLFEAHRDVL